MAWSAISVAVLFALTIGQDMRLPVTSSGGDFIESEITVTEGDLCEVTATVGDVVFVGSGHDLWESLRNLRLSLEQVGLMLWCNGARQNVHASGMQRQWNNGRRAYELAFPRTSNRPPTVDIFGVADSREELVSVADQDIWFQNWMDSAH
jgi:hypothetical protein